LGVASVARRAVLALAVAASVCALAGCGGGRQPATSPPPSDPDLVRQHRLARFAFENGQYGQAAALYEDALARAYARDDIQAIGTVGYELALTYLRMADAAKAAAFARGVEGEMRRRDAVPLVEIKLVQAVASYVGGDAEGAWQAAQDVVAARGGDNAAAAARARYVIGSIAADRGDAETLTQVVSALGQPTSQALRADHLELLGRLQFLQRRDNGALSAFRDAADLRRDLRDYPGMARALAFAGDTAERSGRHAEAADLYLRAGRSAQQEGWKTYARQWLEGASRLASTHGLTEVANEAGRRLKQLDATEKP
jgi:tetratricopeptide (TPR) repeat protein